MSRSAALMALVATTVVSTSAFASSHREAPLITEDPTVDSTDVYAFVSPDGPAPGAGARVTLIANYMPFQEPSGGPNFYNFSDSAIYEIKIDNTGDAVEDIVYQFRFSTTTTNGQTFLYNTGKMDSPDSANRNVTQTYTLTKITYDNSRRYRRGRRTVIARDVPTAPARIGPGSNGTKSEYEAVAAAAVNTAGNVKSFVGPRDEGFYLDIGAIFDLLNISRVAGLGSNTAIDGTAGFNVSSIALEVPVTDLTADGSEPTFGTDMGGANAVIGVWTTASRRKHRVIRRHRNPRDFGPRVQVSRLGLPLINEVVVPLGFKDAFNRSQPRYDLTNIAGFILDPELSRLLNALYSVEIPAPPRVDLVDVIKFLPGALTSRTDLQPADILRLNVSIPATPAANVNPLGVIAGDNAGFPNGRRPGDDVVDILERVVGGGILSSAQTSGGGTFGALFPNNALNDGVNANDVPYLTTFPFLGTPHSGFDRVHQNVAP